MSARALIPYVASLVAYDVDLGGPGVHRGLPSTTVTVVLPVGDPLDVSWEDDDSSRRRDWSSVSGLHASPARIHHGGHQAGVQLALTPAGARGLLGLPAAAISGQLLSLDDLGADLPLPLRRLPDELADLPDGRSRARHVVRRLTEALAATGAPGPRAEVGLALARLGRGARVDAVAGETGYSRRHLTTLVRAECGVGPKEFQRIARFERSRARWAGDLAAGHGSLAAVAADCGYADQAHLTREWVALAGCTPGTWAREEFPFVQDPDRSSPAS